MSEYSVGPSREGDQFHYWRAARLALELLPANSPLKLISIEGVTPADEQEAGIEVIDLSLYYGSEDPAKSDRVEYRQLKHSTRHSTKPFTASGVERTLEHFARRYAALANLHGTARVSKRFRFVFETNRPIAGQVTRAITELIEGRSGKTSDYLRSKLPLKGRRLKQFAALIQLRPLEPGLLAQRTMAGRDFRNYLPDDDKDAPLALKELITRKATTEFETNPDITRHDVLDAAKTTLGDLYPAPNLIEAPTHLVERKPVASVVRSIVDGPNIALVTADGGVGKSVLTRQIGQYLPRCSRLFVYDCFGNGSYRTQSKYRHSVRQGLVQLANEMAGEGLCDLLIPSARSAPDAYARAFADRVARAAEVVALEDPGALLCLVIDAADNAEEAAEEAGESPSFARGLLRETWPGNVRLVVTARPYRADKLRPPPGINRLELPSFSREETGVHLRQFHPDASDADVGEFHRLTSENPRVQATALVAGGTLADLFARLGPNPKSVQDMIGDLLSQAVARVRDSAVGKVEQSQVDHLCVALATLRPFVPLSIVAATASVSVDLVRSFINDLGTPFLIREDAVQFRDEPTESWFRDRFRPSGGQMADFLSRLEPLAASSAYAASSLPQLMLEAGQLDRLVTLTLAGGALPQGNAVTKRDIELQRLQFALRASIRAGRFTDAAKLALKAGGEAAANSRQQELIGENTDLAARFLEPDQLLEQVSRRFVRGGEWTGSEHAYEAGLLAGSPSLRDDARAKLREARGWLTHWRRSPRDKTMTADDLAELAWAELHVHGPESCARFLRRGWKRIASWRAGLRISERLADAGRFEDLDRLAIAARNDFAFILALNSSAVDAGHMLPREAVGRTLKICMDSRIALVPKDIGWRDSVGDEVPAVTKLVQAACHHRLGNKRKLAGLLTRYLPARPPFAFASRHSIRPDERSIYLKAYALRAELGNRSLGLAQLVPDQLREAARRAADHDPEYRRFRETVESLLPFHRLWARLAAGRKVISVATELGVAVAASKKAQGHYPGERSDINDETALAWGGILLAYGARADWLDFAQWLSNPGNHPIGFRALIELTRTAARQQGWAAEALSLAAMANRLMAGFREDASERVRSHLLLSRAVLAVSDAEAASHFEEAVRVAERIGDEGLQRWESLQALAGRSPDGNERPELAYRFSRVLELTHEYFDRDKYYDWEDIIEVIAGLSPASALAIPSRWVDRNFVGEWRVLPDCLEILVKQGKLDPRDALACFPLRAHWSFGTLLSPALDAAASEGERELILQWFMRYFRIGEPGEEQWRALDEILSKRNIPAAGFIPGHAFSPQARQPKKDRSPVHRRKRVPWKRLFRTFDPADAQSIRKTLGRYRKGQYGYGLGDFCTEAVKRVQAGMESRFIERLDEAEELDPHDLRALLDAIPPSWRSQLSVQAQLTSLIRAIYRRQGSRAYIGNRFQAMPLARAAEAAKLHPSKLVLEALETIGQSVVPLEADELFRIVSLASVLLQPPEAQDALAYGLDLLEPALTAEDGDGPWSPALAPAPNVELALASYLWAALGSPDAERRWESAHVVRGLAALGRSAVLERLVGIARQPASEGPFSAPAFRFYRMHAEQWLLIALARAAEESPAAIAAHADFLRSRAQASNKHVIMRHFAACALLSLDKAGAIALVPAEKDSLETLNRSPFPPIDPRARRPGKAPASKPPRGDGFYFPYDFDKYWLAPLGRTFGLQEDEMEQAASAIIRDKWKLKDSGHWKEDARRQQRMFQDERGYSSHGSLPRFDDLSFYLAYHAAMTLAGQLLDTRPVTEDPHDPWDRFSNWLDGQLLTRRDGYWPADRRDEVPIDCRDGGPPPPDPGLLPYREAGELIAAGSWSTFHEGTSRTVRIESALVTPERASALAAALAQSQSFMDYRIPDFGDEMEISEAGYWFKGWVEDPDVEKGLDRHDPWAAELDARTPAPATALTSSLGWRSDPLKRKFEDAKARPMMRCETWSADEDESYRRRRDAREKAHGWRILATPDGVRRLLRLESSTLLIDVRIVRRLPDDGGRQGKRRSSAESLIQWIELVEADGSRRRFRAHPAPRPKARGGIGARRRR